MRLRGAGRRSWRQATRASARRRRPARICAGTKHIFPGVNLLPDAGDQMGKRAAIGPRNAADRGGDHVDLPDTFRDFCGFLWRRAGARTARFQPRGRGPHASSGGQERSTRPSADWQGLCPECMALLRDRLPSRSKPARRSSPYRPSGHNRQVGGPVRGIPPDAVFTGLTDPIKRRACYCPDEPGWAGTPSAIVARLNHEVNHALQSSDRCASLGRFPWVGSPQDFSKLLAEESPKWLAVVRSSGIKFD